MTGYGDVSYNSRRNILGAISLDKKVAYHLWIIEYSQQKNNYNIKLLQKAKWHQFYSTEIGILLIFLILSAYLPNSYRENYVTGLEFNPTGEIVSTIDHYGVCLISDTNTNNHNFHLDLKEDGNRDFKYMLSVLVFFNN